MARGKIDVQPLPVGTLVDQDVVFTAGVQADNHYFLNTGREILLMISAAGGKTATVKSVADEDGRTGDIDLAPAAGKTAAAGPFNPAIFNQRGASDLGKVFVDLDVEAGVTFAVIGLSA